MTSLVEEQPTRWTKLEAPRLGTTDNARIRLVSPYLGKPNLFCLDQSSSSVASPQEMEGTPPLPLVGWVSHPAPRRRHTDACAPVACHQG
jgi:hypothetical protein